MRYKDCVIYVVEGKKRICKFCIRCKRRNYKINWRTYLKKSNKRGGNVGILQMGAGG